MTLSASSVGGFGIETRIDSLAKSNKQDLDEERKRITNEELESARDRQEDLKQQIERCQTLLERSREWVGFAPEPFRDALSCSLGADRRRAANGELGR